MSFVSLFLQKLKCFKLDNFFYPKFDGGFCKFKIKASDHHLNI